MSMPEIVTPDAWNAAREHLLVAEKELTRAKDALAAKRRRMPMTEVTKAYRFAGPEGTKTLAELFDGRRQLIIYRFFMDPDMKAYPERGCPGCSMFADHIGHLNHLRARDVNFVLVSRGEQEHLHRYREAHGLGAALVHAHRRLRQRPRRRGVARDQRLLQGRRRPHLPHLLRQQPWR